MWKFEEVIKSYKVKPTLPSIFVVNALQNYLKSTNFTASSVKMALKKHYRFERLNEIEIYFDNFYFTFPKKRQTQQKISIIKTSFCHSAATWLTLRSSCSSYFWTVLTVFSSRFNSKKNYHRIYMAWKRNECQDQIRCECQHVRQKWRKKRKKKLWVEIFSTLVCYINETKTWIFF